MCILLLKLKLELVLWWKKASFTSLGLMYPCVSQTFEKKNEKVKDSLLIKHFDNW